VPGSPIRTPPDQRSLGSSPGPNAAHHVLHRLLVPRHPPCALTHLPNREHTRSDQGHNNRKPDQNQQTPHQEGPTNPITQKRSLRSRCSHPLSSSQTPHGHQGTHARARHPQHTDRCANQHPNRPRQQPPPHNPTHPHRGWQIRGQEIGPVPSGPNSAPTPPPPHHAPQGPVKDPEKAPAGARPRPP
jgi:hypothetical protein